MNLDPAPRHHGATNAAPAPTDAAAWADPFGLWAGGAAPLAALAGTAGAAERALRIWRGALEANRMVAGALWDATRRQQELTLAAAGAAGDRGLKVMRSLTGMALAAVAATPPRRP